LIDDAAREEENSLHGYDAFQRNLESDVDVRFEGRGFSSHDTVGVLRFVRERFAWLSDSAANPPLEPPALSLLERGHAPLEPTLDQAIGFTAEFDAPIETLSLHYSVDRAQPRIVEMVADENGVWRTQIEPIGHRAEVTWYLRAALADGRSAFFPANNSGEPYTFEVSGIDLPQIETGDLVLNELQARNPDGARDEQNEAEDWLELYNRGSQSVNLEGLFLSDQPDDPWKYALPSLQLSPGQHFQIWADGEPEEGPLHAPFRLDGGGESLVLASRDAILDRIDFERLPAGLSYGRERDGAEAWNACELPSPRQPNRCDGLPMPTLLLPYLGR
jgi:hypothetical protein